MGMETNPIAPMESKLTDIEGLRRAGIFPKGREPSIRTKLKGAARG